MGFVGDLFPRQILPPATVAQTLASMCPLDRYRDAAPEIREVVRTAHEWQGSLKPRQGILDRLTGKPSRAPAGEADFLAAAQVAYERFA